MIKLNYVTNKKTNKKYKLSSKIKLLIGATGVLTMTACGSPNIQNNYTSSTAVSSESTESDNVYVPAMSVDEVTSAQKNIISSNITLDDTDVQKMENLINGITIDYPYSDVFDTDKVLEDLENVKPYTYAKSNNIINNNVVDETKLYNSVVKNNAEHKKNTDKYHQSDITDEEVKNACHIIATTINEDLKNDPDILVDKVDKQLSDLIVVTYQEHSNGYYNFGTNMLGYNRESLKLVDGDFDTNIKDTITHETEHLIQDGAKEEIAANDYSERSGPGYEFNNVDINSASMYWFAEACAEELSKEKNNLEDSQYYAYLICCLDAMRVATVLNDDVEPNDLLYLSFQSDPNKVFDYFGCETEEDKKEFINMSYSLEIIGNDNGAAEGTKFPDAYYKKHGDSATIDLDYEYQMGSAIGASMSKVFYKNLINSVANREVKVQDIYAMMSIYEDKSWNFSRYDDLIYNNAKQQFFETYTDIQDEFFELMSKKMNIPAADLKESYKVYKNKYDDTLSDGFLKKDSEDFYKNQMAKINSSGDAVSYYYDSIQEAIKKTK